MLAQLDGGRLGDARILREETVREMQRRHFSHDPRLVGWALGFEEGRREGLATLEHGGSWRGFGTRLVLAPEARFGVFESSTRDADYRFLEPIVAGLFARYSAAEPAAAAAGAGGGAARHGGGGAVRHAGSYLPNRHVRGDFMKLALLLDECSVTLEPGGALLFHTGQGQRDPLRLVESEPGLFVAPATGEHAVFREGADGEVSALFIDAQAYDKVSGWRRPRVQGAALLLSGGVFLATALGLAAGALVRRAFGGPPAGAPPGVRRLAAAVSVANLLVLAALGVGLLRMSPFELMEGLPAWLRAAGWIPYATLPLSLLLAARWLGGLASPAWTPLARLHFALLVAAAAFFAWFAWTWNLIGLG
jgi:hypothetical protein